MVYAIHEYIVLTNIMEYLGTPHVQCGDIRTLLFTRQSQIANSIGLWKKTSHLYSVVTTKKFGSLRLKYMADRYSLLDDHRFRNKLHKLR